MLLELSVEEIRVYLTDDAKLAQKVEEAKALLDTKSE
jgi:hypothetical protein